MKDSITIDSRGRGIDDLQWLVGKVINKDNMIVDIDTGDCCGWADVETVKDTFNGDVLITSVSSYDGYDEYDDFYEENGVIVTLYGQNKEIYQMNLSDGSGSGWDYGAVATVRIVVNETN